MGRDVGRTGERSYSFRSVIVYARIVASVELAFTFGCFTTVAMDQTRQRR
jgi:hypothetical protein